MKKLASLFLSCLFILQNCNLVDKDSPRPADTSPPNIVINSPNANQLFSPGDTMHISFVVSDNIGVYYPSYYIYRLNDHRNFMGPFGASFPEKLIQVDYDFIVPALVSNQDSLQVMISAYDASNNKQSDSVLVMAEN